MPDMNPENKSSRQSSKAVQLSLKGPSRGGDSVFRLGKDRIVIGSVVSADVRLSGEGVAPIHAVIELAGAGSAITATIYDLASETGVFVNGQKVVTGPLKAGDALRIGPHELSFAISDPEQFVPRERMREADGRRLYLSPDEDLGSLILESEQEARPIFDYRPSHQRALEVVMSWRGTILDVEHFVKEKSVTIGNTRRSDFAIPPVLSSSQVEIVTRSGEDFVLNLAPQMKGVIQRKGALRSFDEVRSEASVSGPRAYGVPIGQEDFAKISIGDIDFYLSYTPAPPRVKNTRILDRDPFFGKIFLASMTLTAGILVAILNATVTPQLEAEQIPERIATILYQPEKYVQKPIVQKVAETKPAETTAKAPEVKAEPKPAQTIKLDITPNAQNANKPVPKEMNVGHQVAQNSKQSASGGRRQGQKEAKEGRGARAKGKEGSRGQPKATAKGTPQDKANRPSPQGGEGRGAGDSQVPSIGNVDFLNSAGAKISNILGNSAEKLGAGGEKLKGFGGFTTQGNGGLALSGEGKGGGGTAEGLGGLSDRGTGGGRIGTGKGAAGSGTGIVGGQARVAIRTGGPEEAVVMGSIDASAVEAALLAHRDEFRLCYEKEINAETPGLAGRVSTSFVIGSTGRVTQAGIEATTLKNANTERCVLTVIRRIDFPIPRGAGIVQVTYPFKFSPTRR